MKKVLFIMVLVLLILDSCNTWDKKQGKAQEIFLETVNKYDPTLQKDFNIDTMEYSDLYIGVPDKILGTLSNTYKTRFDFRKAHIIVEQNKKFRENAKNPYRYVMFGRMWRTNKRTKDKGCDVFYVEFDENITPVDCKSYYDINGVTQKDISDAMFAFDELKRDPSKEYEEAMERMGK